ncbi:MAG: hypothetical protein K2X29_01475 [Candidatus Obscuribacterales bacterium]|nr:hypothetical protein [Candidatus Obscuribacterales bacterium]
MNIFKLLLPLMMMLTIGGTNITPAYADNRPATVIADRGCYDNYQCPGAYRRYPYWVPQRGYSPIQCGHPRRYRQYRTPRYYRVPRQYRNYRHHQQRHYRHCR